MNFAKLAVGIVAFLNFSLSVSAQDCLISHSDPWEKEAAMQICNAVGSFNNRGVPGIIADDCEGEDCCDDEDPSWLPSPPFSAIISISAQGFFIHNLDDGQAEEIRGALIDSGFFNGFGSLQEKQFIPSLDDDLPSSTLSVMIQLMEQDRWVEQRILNGNLVYYYITKD